RRAPLPTSGLGPRAGPTPPLTSTFPTPGTVETVFSTITGSSCADGQIGRGQRHVDLHRAIVGDVNAVNQTDLVDVGRNFRIIDGLERVTISSVSRVISSSGS